MNVAFYTDQTISGMTGGIGRVTDVLTHYFRNQLGWKVFSIYAAEAKADCVRTPLDGAVMLRLHDRLGIRCDARSNVKRAVVWLVEHEVDVLIVQTSMEVVARLKRYMKGLGIDIKVVSVLHFEPGKDEWPWRLDTWMVKRIVARLRNSVIHRATQRGYRSALVEGDAVGLLSPVYIEPYIAYCGLLGTTKMPLYGGKFFAIPNPLSFPEILPVSSLAKKEKIVLVVARMMESQKRISHILNMWHVLQNNGFRLVLVGDGPSLAYYKAQAEALQLKNVSFEGRQNPKPYYEKAQIFLMTSAFEGFPMTLVEAQQHGCVPVAYQSFAALGDVLNDGVNGCIVKNDDEGAFVERVECLMRDDAYRNQLAEGALRDCVRFTPEKVGQQWKTVLEGVCEG